MRSIPALFVILALPAFVAADDKAKPIGPAEASKKVGEHVTVLMKVESTGKGRSGVHFLNSKANYKDEGNFTIFIPKSAVTSFDNQKIGDPSGYFKDKTVRVTGVVKLYQGRPEIVLEDPQRIEIVQKN
jgi:DNA/RNA endonuclease YhcR with UshA esterase domain